MPGHFWIFSIDFRKAKWSKVPNFGGELPGPWNALNTFLSLLYKSISSIVALLSIYLIKKYKSLDCSLFCCKARKEARARKCRGELRPIGEYSLLFKCCSRFLRALQQNRTQLRLLYLFYDKEQVISKIRLYFSSVRSLYRTEVWSECLKQCLKLFKH